MELTARDYRIRAKAKRVQQAEHYTIVQSTKQNLFQEYMESENIRVCNPVHIPRKYKKRIPVVPTKIQVLGPITISFN